MAVRGGDTAALFGLSGHLTVCHQHRAESHTVLDPPFPNSAGVQVTNVHNMVFVQTHEA